MAALNIGRRNLSLIPLSVAYLFIGCLLLGVNRILPQDHISNFTPVEAEEAYISGVITEEPSVSVAYYGGRRFNFILSSRQIQQGDRNVRVSGKVRVSVTGEPGFPLSYGDLLVMKGKLSRPSGPFNPGGFDRGAYLAREGIFSSFNSGASNVKLAGKERLNPILRLAYEFREKIRQVIYRDIQGDPADLLAAVLLGLRRDIDSGINDDFMKTGTVHLLAISGLNIGMIAFIAVLLLGMARVPKRAAIPVVILMLIFYAILTNATPSVVRATVMSIAVLSGLLIGRDTSLWNSLGLAAVIILSFDPNALFDAGFQLSFVSVASLLYFMPEIKTRFRTGNYMAECFFVSIAAWIGTAPLILEYFNIVTPIAVISNLIAVPLSFAITAASVPFMIFAFIFPPLGKIFAASVWFLCEALFKSNSILAAIPMGHIYLPKPPVIAVVFYYIFIAVFMARRKLNIRPFYFAAVILTAVAITAWTNALAPASRSLRVTFLDVGHGDSVFLEFPGGSNMLIDGGSGGQEDWDAGRDVVLPFLRCKGIQVLDAVVLTHPDSDHVGGLVSIMDGMRVRYIFDSGAGSGSAVYKSFDDLISGKRVVRYLLKRGDGIAGIKDVSIFCLNPASGRALEENIPVNDKSVVLKVRFKGTSAMFCGDAVGMPLSEIAMIYPAQMRSSLLMMPHHGGEIKGGWEPFVGAVGPSIAVISQGRAQKEIERSARLQEALESRGIEAYRTNSSGAVIAASDGVKFHVDKWRPGGIKLCQIEGR